MADEELRNTTSRMQSLTCASGLLLNPNSAKPNSLDQTNRLCLDSKIGGGKMPSNQVVFGAALCLDSKIGGGKIMRSYMLAREELCLDSKIGGGKISQRVYPLLSWLCLDSKIGGGKI